MTEAAWLGLPWSVLGRLALLAVPEQPGTDDFPPFCFPERFPIIWRHEGQGSS